MSLDRAIIKVRQELAAACRVAKREGAADLAQNLEYYLETMRANLDNDKLGDTQKVSLFVSIVDIMEDIVSSAKVKANRI